MSQAVLAILHKQQFFENFQKSIVFKKWDDD